MVRNVALRGQQGPCDGKQIGFAPERASTYYPEPFQARGLAYEFARDKDLVAPNLLASCQSTYCILPVQLPAIWFLVNCMYVLMANLLMQSLPRSIPCPRFGVKSHKPCWTETNHVINLNAHARAGRLRDQVTPLIAAKIDA
jgi:hypothetical protein